MQKFIKNIIYKTITKKECLHSVTFMYTNDIILILIIILTYYKKLFEEKNETRIRNGLAYFY